MTEWKGWQMSETVGMEQKDVYACIRYKGKLYRSKQDVLDAGI